jgi:hypothetical protein
MIKIPWDILKQIVRMSGFLLGVFLLDSYASSLTDELELGGMLADRIMDHAAGLIFAILLMFPWRMIKSRYLWIVLFIIFCGVFLKAMSMWLLADMWAYLHQIKGAGAHSTIMGLIAIMQMIVIWTLRPKMR